MASPSRRHKEIAAMEAAVLDEDQLDDVALTLSQDDVNRISTLTGKNILTGADLISQIAFLTCVSVDGVQIPLETGLLSRLKSRCYKTPFPQFLREIVVKQLHDFAGW